MREIKGVVCVSPVKRPDSIEVVLFGPNVNLSVERQYENFVSNGLVPFPDRVAALPAYRALQSRIDLQDPSLAAVEMTMMEEDSEIAYFRRRRRLVVVMQHAGQPTAIFGLPHHDGLRVGYIGTTLFSSGINPFTNFEQAYYTAAQANRQGQGTGHLATWKFEYLPVPKIGSTHPDPQVS